MKLTRFAVPFIAAAAFALAGPAVHAQGKTLKVAPHAFPSNLDPINVTAYITRNHGYMIYDTLFGTDEKGAIKPQMVDRWTTSPDGKIWTFTLRNGLEFHDGKPVTGGTWSPRSAAGARATPSVRS